MSLLQVLEDVLSAEAVEAVRDGSIAAEQAQSLVEEALNAHPIFQLAVQPRAFSCVDMQRYDSENTPCERVADAVTPEFVRADVGVILALSGPSQYGGGDIGFDIGFGRELVNVQEGHCVLFPASALRRVAAVTQGALETAELWVQSLVQDPAARQILYDISYSQRLLEVFGQGASPAGERLRRTGRNLLRHWARP